MSDSDQRPRGILTPKDRQLLHGEVEYDHPQQYSDRRRTIRERITNAILDFPTIQYSLRDDDRKRIFRDPSREASVEDANFHESVRSMLYWSYFGLKEQNYDFEGLLTEAIEEAEEEFAQKYWGERVDASVRLDIDVTRAYETEDLISAVERGGPVQANRLYNLLTLSGGVPIDTSKLDTVRVWFSSSYPEGEMAVLETMFSEYLGVEVEVKDAIARVSLEDQDIEKRKNAVVDKDRPRPNPSEIKNYRTSTGREVNLEAVKEEVHRQRILGESTDEDDSTPENEDHSLENDESILEAVIDDFVENAESPPPSILDIIDDRGEKNENGRDEEVTPEKVLELLKRIRDPFVSTVEVATALGCAKDAARHSLSTLANSKRVYRHPVIGDDGDRIVVWWLAEEPEEEPNAPQ